MEELKPKESFFKTLFSKLTFSASGTKEFSVLDKTIKILIYALVVLVPLWFLPITVSTLEFNKQVLMVFLVVITLIFWLIKIINQGEIEWKSNILNILLGVFAVIYILATIFSLRPYTSLVGSANSLGGSLISILTFLAIFLLIANNFKGAKDVFGLLLAFIVSSAIVSVVGLIQLWGGFIFPWGFTKLTSFNTVGSANALGLFSAAILTIISALLFVIKRSKIMILLIILGILNFLILLSLNFWILWLVSAVGMAFIVVFGLMKTIELEGNISWLVLPIVLLVFSLLFVFIRPNLPLKPNLPIEIGLSHKGTINIIKEIVKEKPILGTGPETFFIDYLKYKPKEINQTVFWNVRFYNPASEVYSIILETGILGILSFLAIVVFFIIKAMRNLLEPKENILKKFLEIGLFGGWLVLLVGIFLYPQNLTLMFTFWLLFSLYLVGGSVFKEKSYNLRKTPKVLLLTTLSFVVVIVVVIGFLYIEGIRFVAEAKYKNGFNLIQNNNELDKGIEKIVSSATINPYEDKSYVALAELFLLKANKDIGLANISAQEKTNLVQADMVNAINAATQATRLFPQNVTNWLTRGRVYYEVMQYINGALDWAEISYNKAVELEPLNPMIFTEWGRVYLKQADLISSEIDKTAGVKEKWQELLNKAMEKLNQAVSLKSDYAPAQFEIAMIYNRQGKLAEAIKKMEISKTLLPRDAGIAFRLGVLYYKAEKYPQAKAEFIRAVALENNFSNARYFLGLLYDEEGNKESALDQFNRIAELNPDNEEVKQIITNLNAGLPALGSPELGPPKQPQNIPIEEQPKEQK